MAKLTPSVIVGNMSGKIAGSVLLNGVGSLSIRPRAKRKRQQSPRQSLTSTTIGNISKQWKTLSQAERNNWNAAVGSYPINDRLSQVIYPTGFALFCGINTARRIANTGFTADTPVPQFLPPIDDAFALASTSAISVSITFNSAPDPFRLMFFCSRPVSPGISSFSKSDVVFIRAEVAQEDTTYDLTVFYNLVLGSLANKAGQKIAFEVWAIADQCDSQILIFSDQVIIT